MALTIEEKKAIIAYRIQKAENAMIEANDNANLKHWSLVANRLYYAVFHMASALMIDKGFTVKSHSGLICLLGQEFVVRGLLDKDDAKLASRLMNMRQSNAVTHIMLTSKGYCRSWCCNDEKIGEYSVIGGNLPN